MDIMEGKPYKMKSDNISDAEIKTVAAYIIERHAEDIEYLSVTEMTEYEIEGITEMPIDEQEKIWRRVDDMIRKAEVTITFRD
jgi:hypothetical protein